MNRLAVVGQGQCNIGVGRKNFVELIFSDHRRGLGVGSAALAAKLAVREGKGRLRSQSRGSFAQLVAGGRISRRRQVTAKVHPVMDGPGPSAQPRSLQRGKTWLVSCKRHKLAVTVSRTGCARTVAMLFPTGFYCSHRHPGASPRTQQGLAQNST
jgi:hypothetical protein